MDKNSLHVKESFNVNSKNNRYILKLFGEMNHDYISIEKDELLTISKTKIDNFEKKGQISKWQFKLDQIYSQNTTFEELYENEIENSDFLTDFNKDSLYRTIVFIGDRNDSLSEEPYKGFISKCIKECLNGNIINLNPKKINSDESLIPIVSFSEINKMYAIDYFKNITDLNNFDRSKNNNIISNPKLNFYEDDIIIDELSQIQISNEDEFISLLNLSKKNVDFFKFNKWKISAQDESITQIISLKLLSSSTHECYSKINFVLYKAYEILDDKSSDNNNEVDNIPESIINMALGNKSLKRTIKINQSNKNKSKSKTKNVLYNLYTKDNYAFFNGIQNKINYRISYIIKYLKDTLIKGNNLFVVLLPCEYQYLVLIHDLLDNINMRKLIVENIIVDEQDNISNYPNGEIYKFENASELNDIENNENEKYDEICSFQSFSKNSINTNISSAFYNEGKGRNFLSNSCIYNELTQNKSRRKELNIERLKKINDKTNIINLFDMFDQILVNDHEYNE